MIGIQRAIESSAENETIGHSEHKIIIQSHVNKSIIMNC